VRQDIHPAWSPHGDWIAFVRVAPADSGGIYLIPMDGPAAAGAPVRFPGVSRTHAVTHLSFSPEGDRVVFQQAGNLYVADLPTWSIERITSHYRAAHPSWHPSGELLLYAHTSLPAGQPQDSSGIRELDLRTRVDRPFRREADGEPVSGSFPLWSPAGDRIVFTAYTRGTGGYELYETSRADRVNRRLATTGWKCTPVAWLDESDVVFTRAVDDGEATYAVAVGARTPRWFPTLRNPIPLGPDFDLSPHRTHAVAIRAGPSGVVVLWIVDLGAPPGSWSSLTEVVGCRRAP
jgi:Tol biopolymer transport system component